MSLATLAEVLGPANRAGHAVAGFVCQGWEDTRAYVTAAEEEGLPVILQAGPGARAHMPVALWGAMFGHLARAARVPVVAHLDHGQSAEDCAAAIAAGFSSVMFDGSALPLDENIAQTARIVRMAHEAGISCEGEIGFVGYDRGAASRGTDPQEAARFAAETGVDAMAISVGNLHLQRQQAAQIDMHRLNAIAAACDVPLVLHGGSGIPGPVRQRLARMTPVAKFNLGTELRQVFGQSLRAALDADPEVFDRITLLSATEPALVAAARAILRQIGPGDAP